MRFVLSDSSLNYYGFRVLTKGIDYSDFLNNPIMFYKHNRDLLPIGKWVDIKIEGDKLTAEPVFDMTDEFAVKIKSKVDQGILNTASIGFDIIELSDDPKLLVPGQTRPTVSKSILNETSIADIPGNKKALKLHFSNGLTLSGDLPEDHLNYVLPILTKKNMSKVALALGLSADATEEQIVTALSGVTKKHQDDAVQALVVLGENKGFKKEIIEKLAKADFNATLTLIQEASVPVVPANEDGEETNKDKGRLSDLVAEAKKQLTKSDKSEKEDLRASWNLTKWEKEDSSGLKTMLTKEPAKYQKLFAEAHGYTPTLQEISDINSLS